MQFRFYERAILILFVVATVAAAIWWALTGSWLAASAAVVSLALVLVFTILFFGSALERRGSQDGVDTFRQGAEFARDLMADSLHYWTQQQIASQKTNQALVRSDGHYARAQAGAMTQMVKWAIGLADEMAGARMAAQAQPAPEWWQQGGAGAPDDDYIYVDAEAYDPEYADDPAPRGRGQQGGPIQW